MRAEGSWFVKRVATGELASGVMPGVGTGQDVVVALPQVALVAGETRGKVEAPRAYASPWNLPESTLRGAAAPAACR